MFTVQDVHVIWPWSVEVFAYNYTNKNLCFLSHYIMQKHDNTKQQPTPALASQL